MRLSLSALMVITITSCTHNNNTSIALDTTTKIPRPTPIISKTINTTNKKDSKPTEIDNTQQKIIVSDNTEQNIDSYSSDELTHNDIKSDSDPKEKKNIQIESNAILQPDLVWPTKGYIIKHFKTGPIPILGIHILSSIGEKVMSCLDGEVIVSMMHSKFDNMIIIKSNNDIQIAYSYLGTRVPNVGTYVKKGQVIGTIKGVNNNPILYLAMQKQQVYSDPIKYFTKEQIKFEKIQKESE